jgi:MFS transporter, DHA2 family, methylenomycin A resistance protein
VTACLATSTTPVRLAAPAPGGALAGDRHARLALAAAVLGFFVVTLDAVVVKVTLPTIRGDLGGGVAGLQWVVDGFTLMFAALLLSAGSLSDRVGARRAFAAGIVVFVLASVACGLAPSLGVLVAARFVQGAAAAAMMPASMALIRQAFPEPKSRGRAVGVWAMGGAVASSSGPVLGGVLNLVDWRLIFFINVPVGAIALLLVARTEPSRPRVVPFDLTGQVTGVIAMSGLTFGVIEAGSQGFASPLVVAAFAIAVLAAAGFLRTQQTVRHPMLPLELFGSRTVVITVASGFAFMVGYYGLPFVISLFLQQHRGLTALQTGVVFLPMMIIGAVLTPFSARIGERVGRKTIIVTGLALMTAGLAVIALLPAAAPLWLLALLMMLVGLGGPTVSPPATAVLLDAVPERQAGVASGVFNFDALLGIKREVERTQLRARNGISLIARRPPAQISVTPKDEVWSLGKAKLWRYRNTNVRHEPPVLLFLGLVGDSSIFDIHPGNSWAERLVSEGFDVFLFDWGRPDDAEGDHTLETYLSEYFGHAIDMVRRVAATDEVSMGAYCMGALMILLLLGSRDDVRVKNLVLFTPPCDFDHSPAFMRAFREGRIKPADIIDQTTGVVPESAIRAMFRLLQPASGLVQYVTLWDTCGVRTT